MMFNTANVEQAPLQIYFSSATEPNNETQNNVSFNFRNPITKDSEDVGFVTLASFQGFNTFANIAAEQENNVVIITTVTRNNATGVYQTFDIRIVIPDGRYTADALFALLNNQCNQNLEIAPDAFETFGSEAYLYLGFGFNGDQNDATDTPLQGFTYYPNDPAKVAFFPASYAGISTGNAYQKTYVNGYTIATDPFAYAGVYLKETPETLGFLNLLGYSRNTGTTLIPTTSYFGYGYTFDPLVANPAPAAPLPLPFCYNLSGPTALYFTIDNVTTPSRHNDETLDSRSILGVIPINVLYGELITYQQTFEQYGIVNSQIACTTLRVVIYDQNGRQVNFRSRAGWTASIQMEFKTNSRDTTLLQNTGQAGHQVVFHPHHGTRAHALSNRPHPLGGIHPGLGFSKRATPHELLPEKRRLGTG
jgi:hypothetical protein